MLDKLMWKFLFVNLQTLQTKAAIGEREGKIDNKTRIELIKEEERKIKEERMEARRQELLKKEQEQAKREIQGSHKKSLQMYTKIIGKVSIEI